MFGQFPNVDLIRVGSRGELVANCVHTADADELSRVGVGGVYWTLHLYYAC